MNFRRPVEVQRFSEACFQFPNFLYYARMLHAQCVLHLYKIGFLFVSYLENANGSINLQSAVSGNDYTVKFSKAVQSGDV